MQSILDPSLIHIVSYIHTGFIVNTCDDVCIYIVVYNHIYSCVTQVWKSFKERRPSGMLEDGSPLYLNQKLDNQIQNGPTRDIWYKSGPLGKNKIATLLPDACKLAGIEKRNNHGVRATAVIRLRKGGLPDDKIIQITGHKSIHSLSSYDNERMDVIERQQCQNVLLNSVRPQNASSTVSADHSSYIPEPYVGSVAPHFALSAGSVVPHRALLPGSVVPHRALLPGSVVPHRALLPGSVVPHHDLLPGSVIPHRDLPPGSVVPHRDLPPGSVVPHRDLPPPYVPAVALSDPAHSNNAVAPHSAWSNHRTDVSTPGVMFSGVTFQDCV